MADSAVSLCNTVVGSKPWWLLSGSSPLFSWLAVLVDWLISGGSPLFSWLADLVDWLISGGSPLFSWLDDLADISGGSYWMDSHTEHNKAMRQIAHRNAICFMKEDK